MQVVLFLLYCGACLLTFIDAQSYIPTPAYPQEDGSKISRGSGTGVISFGYAVIVLAAFALFVILTGLMVCYMRGKGIRNNEKTLFLVPY